MQKMFLLIAALLVLQCASAQTVTGIWKTVDDASGEAKSQVELYEFSGKMYGKVLKTLRPNAAQICTSCPDERKNQPIVGMIILIDLVLKEGMWQSGNILDPEKGKWYGCKVWLKDGDPNTLVVRGSLGPFYRTQYWSRVR